MRLMFLLKKRTGLNISDNCLARLSFEVARIKAAAAATEKEVKQEPEPAPVEEKPKKKRGRKPKAEEAA